MKQRFTKLLAAFALLVFMMPSLAGWGQTTATVTASKPSSQTSWNWTDDKNNTWSANVTWKSTEPSNATSMNSGYYQMGTSSNPATSVEFTTSGIAGTITQIVVNCASYQGKGNVSCTVNNSAFGTQSQSIPTWSSNSGGNVTFSNTNGATGAINITLTNDNNTGRAMYIKSIAVTYTSGGTSYTISAQSNNPAYGTVSLSGSVITGSPVDGCRYANPAYTVDPANSATVEQEGNVFTVTPSANTTVTINFEPIPTHTATFSVNGTTTTQDFAEGAAIIFPSDPDDINDMTFVGWVTEAIDGITNTAPSFVNTATATMGNSDITYYAVFAGGSGTYEETLTISNQDFTQVLTGSYASASITKTVGVTDYIINLFACKQNSMCQLRASDSYIQIPTLPGKITNISTTACNNAGNESYTGTIRLKSAFASGNTTTNDIFTKELSSVNSFSIDLTGDIRSFYFVTSAGLRVNDLTVTYNATSYSEYCTTVPEVAVAKPVITVAENPFLFSTTVTITCATEGATIKYSYDGEAWNDYSTTLTINETKTIYAKGVNGTDESSIASVTATKNLADPTIAIDDTGITNIDVYLGTDAGNLSASITYNNAPIQGATVTWSGNNNAVATIDANSGAVTLSGKGIVIFTATFAGDGNYASATANYQLTVTSSAPSVDYAVLPFVWAGGASMDFEEMNGVTLVGNGNDYDFDDHSPYLIKFDGTGDFIMIKTDSQPGIVTIGVKMIGGSNSSTITIQGSADGEIFTDIQVLTISGTQNSVHNLTTTNAFAATDRYVKMLFTKGSNVGVGPITITKVYTKTINAYDPEANPANGWYLIASPLTENTAPTAINGLVASDGHYDLYRFNQNPTVTNNDYLEWENYKIHSNDFVLENGKGYLYASQASTTLYFNGECNTGDTKTVDLDYSETNPDVNMRGWNLVGNPFTTASNINLPFYKMNDGGTALTSKLESGTIAAMEGAFVYAYDETSHQAISSVTFTASRSRGNSNASVNINVMHNGAAIDNAIVRFDEGKQLPKFQIFENSTKLYIPQNGKDYAVVSSEAQGEMPVSFKAKENGTYTLDIDTENVEMNYLHLVDNMTGMDVDLLQTPSYTFDATTNDYTSRFRLVFSANDVNEQNAETFAFFSNGNWVVNNEGEATLQVIDVNGRIVSNETINGTVATSINATPGVYMLRLVNGNEVKTQKIVVR